MRTVKACAAQTLRNRCADPSQLRLSPSPRRIGEPTIGPLSRSTLRPWNSNRQVIHDAARRLADNLPVLPSKEVGAAADDTTKSDAVTPANVDVSVSSSRSA